MHFNNSNSLLFMEDDESFSDWDLLPEQALIEFPPLPPLLSESNGLPPLPESLDHFNDLPDQALVPYHYYAPQPSKDLAFDDIDLDSFSWDGSRLAPMYDAMPLNVMIEAPIADHINGIRADEEKQMARRATRSSDIGFDEIKRHFYMPITRAAKEMNVGLTVLKKRCRELGIPRWPHRKMKSLNSLIYNVQELGMSKGEEIIRRELETLEEQRRRMEENPQIQLTESTKKLRQFCFKANYKKRRGMMHPYLDHHRGFIQ